MSVKEENGFSLVEIMLSIVLASVALYVGTLLLALGNQVSSRTEALLAANSAAFSKVQEYENKSFDNIPIGIDSNEYEVEDFSSTLPTITGGFIKSGTAKVYTQYANEYTASLIKMTVKIDFKYGNRDRLIEYATYIQLGGVGR